MDLKFTLRVTLENFSMRSTGKRRRGGGEEKLNTRRIIQSAFMDSIESGNKRGGKRKDSKGKKK